LQKALATEHSAPTTGTSAIDKLGEDVWTMILEHLEQPRPYADGANEGGPDMLLQPDLARCMRVCSVSGHMYT
jgi:hypothetical protein